jgi:hypothetical protein
MFIYQYCRCCAAYIDYTPSRDAEISVRYSVLPCLLYFKLMQATDLDTIHTHRQGQVLFNSEGNENEIATPNISVLWDV